MKKRILKYLTTFKTSFLGVTLSAFALCVSTFFKYGGFTRLLKKPLPARAPLSLLLSFSHLTTSTLHKIKKHSAHSLIYCISTLINLHKIYHVERAGSRVWCSLSRDPALSANVLIPWVRECAECNYKFFMYSFVVGTPLYHAFRTGFIAF